MKFKKIYIVDTNIILNDASNIIKLSQQNENLIVIPETVINELDAKKTMRSDEDPNISWQAREFSRMLVDGTSKKTKMLKKSFETEYTLKTGEKVLIVGLHKYKTKGLDSKVINDRKIIQVAKLVSKKNPNSKFISLDMMCRIYASIDGVESEVLDLGGVELKHEFVKTLSVSVDINDGEYIKNIDPDYIHENYNYIFLNGEQETVAYIKDGIINIVNKTELLKSDIKPKNNEQALVLTAMQDTDLDLVLVEAPAGSGKTLLALHSGIKLVKTKKYDKIVYIRNSINSTDKGEDVGFLAGNKEKFDVYNHPLFDTLDFLVRNKNKHQKKELTEIEISKKIEQMQSDYNITAVWPGSIRGRTISNAYVIIDEVQNFSRKTLQTTLSRFDDDCKVVCIGSNRQIDNMYVTKYTNGLSLLLASAKKPQSIKLFATELHKIFRGRITEWTEAVFS